MRRLSGYVVSLLLAAVLVGSAVASGCTARASGTIKGARANVDRGAEQAQAKDAQQRDGAQSGH
jgi:hypothetical protein